MAKPITTHCRELMQKHRLAPEIMPQRVVMKRLKLGDDYAKFYRLFYRATMGDAKR